MLLLDFDRSCSDLSYVFDYLNEYSILCMTEICYRESFEIHCLAAMANALHRMLRASSTVVNDVGLIGSRRLQLQIVQNRHDTSLYDMHVCVHVFGYDRNQYVAESME